MEATSAVERRRRLRAGLRHLHDAMPEAMRGFGDLHRAATADGALTTAEKELMALAIGIAAGCSDCIALHVHDSLRAGATPDQVNEAIAVAVMMGGGRATMYAIEAVEALDDFRAALSSPMAARGGER